MFESLWPDLLRKKGFMQEFITPIIKVSKGKEIRSFYTMPEYENFKQEMANINNKGQQTPIISSSKALKGYHVKYYKGLGTSTAAEAKEYFRDIDYHKKDFVWKGERETRDKIDLAFNKERADDRKRWLEKFEEGTFIDNSQASISYVDFIDKELILYSRADCIRSIPSFVDGFKPGQRKVLYACFKRKLKQEIKVSQLSGYIAEVTSYHHGDVSLQSTIVNLARDFVGSNNLNLLLPLGQFGTRRQGGKDAASARYINTKLSPLARLVFPEHDDKLLKYLDDDGQPIEPEWYVPIIPLALVNGAEGIGMGYSTKIPLFNPMDIVENLRRAMRGEAMLNMTPWYRDFNGSILFSEAEDKFFSFGKVYKTPEGTIEITELPIGKWTDDYKEFLMECEDKADAIASAATKKAKTKEKLKGKKNEKVKKKKEKPDQKQDNSESSSESQQEEAPTKVKGRTKSQADAWVKDFSEYHTDVKVHFSINIAEGHEHDFDGDDAYKKLQLTTALNTSNMTLFGANGNIRKFEKPLQIIEEYIPLRLDYYARRKRWLLKVLDLQKRKLSEKMRFILMVVNNQLEIRNRPRALIDQELKKNNFIEMDKRDLDILEGRIGQVGDDEDSGSEDEDQEEDDDQDEDEDGNGISRERQMKQDKEKQRKSQKKNQPKRQVNHGYDYLLGIPLWSLTKEKVDELRAELEQKEAEIRVLQKKTEQILWEEDLKAFEQGWI
ncbi:MAG: putative DNA topoisomerase 2, partial [Streblomastix strix]